MRAIVAAAFAATALVTFLASPVTAAEPVSANACPGPVISDSYDPAERIVEVRLVATGCAAREHARFPLSVRIERSDFGSDAVERTSMCGPFRSKDEEGSTYSCTATAILVHPSEDGADYSITVAYPGNDGVETATFKSVCTTDNQIAECEEKAQVLTGHGGRPA